MRPAAGAQEGSGKTGDPRAGREPEPGRGKEAQAGGAGPGGRGAGTSPHKGEKLLLSACELWVGGLFGSGMWEKEVTELPNNLLFHSQEATWAAGGIGVSLELPVSHGGKGSGQV